jgi:hypothetical protein
MAVNEKKLSKTDQSHQQWRSWDKPQVMSKLKKIRSDVKNENLWGSIMGI